MEIRRGFREMIVVVTLIILIAFGARLFLATNVHKKGENLYEIEIIGYRSTETYFTKSYKFDENHCITFTDEFGFGRTICGEVNITKY
jgi:hypothetical protein